jgi:hypothetical protein
VLAFDYVTTPPVMLRLISISSSRGTVDKVIKRIMGLVDVRVHRPTRRKIII